MVDRRPPTSYEDAFGVEVRKRHPRLVVEVGAGGVDTALHLDKLHFFNNTKSRLLLIDNDPKGMLFEGISISLMKQFFPEGETQVLMGQLSLVTDPVAEIWIRNLLTDPNMDKPEARHELYQMIKGVLMPEGVVMLVETYHTAKQELLGLEEEIRSFFDGFTIERMDLEKDEHPYVEIYRKLDPAYMDQDSPKLALRISRVNRSDNG